jgi:peptidoglycan/LPS O-acetylase OafA/YrhL
LKWEWLFYLWLPLAGCFRKLWQITLFVIFMILVFMDPRDLIHGESDAVFVLAFYCGGLMCYVDRLGKSLLERLSAMFTSPIFVFVWICIIALYLSRLGLPIAPVRSLPILGISFGIFLYFWSSQYRPQQWIFHPSVQLIGQISYSLYLWHLAVNWYVAKIGMKVVNFDSVWTYMIVSALMLTIALAAAFVSYMKIEAPFMYRTGATPNRAVALAGDVQDARP